MHGYHDRNDQLTPRMETNSACTQCHEDIRENLTAHTKHAANSAGSSCYNCHMPHKTYGLLSAIRSHQIDSPSVAAQLKTGRVNACNLCHINKSLSWTNEHLAEWYNQKPAELNTEAKRTTQIQKTRTDWEKQLPHQTGVTQQIELLIDGQGKPIEVEARRLEAKRNNRPMTLQG